MRHETANSVRTPSWQELEVVFTQALEMAAGFRNQEEELFPLWGVACFGGISPY